MTKEIKKKYRSRRPRRDTSNDYINNKALYEVMLQFYNDNQEAKSRGLPRPEIPKYVGECLLMIAQKLATKPNFIGYSYKDEMISDGVLNCITYAVEAFDPYKTQNPFAYFTQTIFFAFIRRIESERKQSYVKYKNYTLMNLHDNLDGVDVPTNELNQQINSFIGAYEKKLTEDRKSAKIKRKLAKEKAMSNDN